MSIGCVQDCGPALPSAGKRSKAANSCWLGISNLNAFNKKDRDDGFPIQLEALGHPIYIHASFPTLYLSCPCVMLP